MSRRNVPFVGSPVYQITVGDIAAGTSQQFDLDADTSVHKKYIPFDFIEITNSNADTFELLLNDTHRFAIPGNASMNKSDIAFRRFTIHNTSVNPLVGANMYVSVQHSPLNADKAARTPKKKSLIDYLPLAGFLFR